MQAIRFHQHGHPGEVLQVEDVPTPTPGRGEVLVKMQASPVNPSDLLSIEGRYGQSITLPATPGFEGVGIVESSGGGLLGKMLIGKRVAAINRGGGNWAEYAVVPARMAVPVPSALSRDEAATFFVNPATAVVMTQRVLKVGQGEWLLQSAAASSLGRMIIRLAQHVGFRTLNVVRRAEQVDQLKSIGADEVVKFDAAVDDTDHLVEQVRRISDGGVPCAIDPVSGLVGSTLVRCLQTHGRLLTYGTLTDEPLSIAPRHLIGPQASVEGFWLGRWMDEQSLITKIRLLREVGSLIGAGVLTTDIAARIPLAELPAALEKAPSGKILVTTDAAG